MKATKLLLSVMLVIACLFTTSMNVLAVDNVVAEQQAKEKWPMPTNLQWTEDWKAQWTTTSTEESVESYDIDVRMNGGAWTVVQVGEGQRPYSAVQTMDWIKAVVDESGDYQFRVKSVPYDSGSYEGSDWTEASAVKTYVRPETALPTPEPYWDENEQGVVHFKAVGETSFYWVQVYIIDENGNEGRRGGYIYDLRPDENGICTLNVTDRLRTDGTYCVKVKAISKDITTVANSVWSENSAPLVIGGDDATGSIVYEDGKFIYYNTDGQKDPNKTGLVQYNDIWYYVENGEVHPEDTEVHVVNYGSSMFIAYGGTVLTSANGAFNVPNTDLWYFCSNGQVQTNYNDLALYDGEWFVVENGVINVNYNGIYEYNGGKFFVAAGQLKRAVTGLQQDPISGNWYYFANGEAQVNYTGLATYDGEWFYVVKGMLAEDYSGKVKYDGKDFNVVNGMVKY